MDIENGHIGGCDQSSKTLFYNLGYKISANTQCSDLCVCLLSGRPRVQFPPGAGLSSLYEVLPRNAWLSLIDLSCLLLLFTFERSDLSSYSSLYVFKIKLHFPLEAFSSSILLPNVSFMGLKFPT
jgi:hypothetical protein